MQCNQLTTTWHYFYYDHSGMSTIPTRILLVEDEANLATIIQESLGMRGFEVTICGHKSTGLETYYSLKPHLVILDVMLPDGDGFELARQIRNDNLQIPVIFLTSRSLPQDVVQGFESGGNDYLRKPFSLEELVIRIRALLNPQRHLFDQPPQEKYQFGKYTFTPHSGLLLFGTKQTQLTSREAALLQLLAGHKNQTVERQHLLLKIWGQHDFFTGRSLDVFITRLRKYLSGDPAVSIMNVRGIGYRLVAP
jgi:DNA-binding response OmpR family regulator